MCPRTADQFREMREATRSKILDGAMAVFHENGVHAASMDAIARRAGVSKGLAYNYFTSKENLILALVETWLSELGSFWDGLESEPTPMKRLARVIDRFCESVKRDPKRYRLYLTVFLGLDYLAAVEAASQASDPLFRRIGRIRSVSRQLFVQLGADDPEAEVAFFRMLTTGLAAEYVMSPRSFPLKAIKRRILSYYNSLSDARRL